MILGRFPKIHQVDKNSWPKESTERKREDKQTEEETIPTASLLQKSGVIEFEENSAPRNSPRHSKGQQLAKFDRTITPSVSTTPFRGPAYVNNKKPWRHQPLPDAKLAQLYILESHQDSTVPSPPPVTSSSHQRKHWQTLIPWWPTVTPKRWDNL